MAYTAKGTYFDSGVAKDDKALITGYQQQWAAADAASKAAKAAGDTAAYAAAEAAKTAAHEGAEAVRSSYGYSGGGDGSGYIPVQTAAPQAVQPARQSTGGGSSSSMASELKTLYDAQNAAYQQQLAAQQAAREAAVQKAVGSLESQKSGTETAYSDLFRQLYIDRMKNQKNLDQRLAAGGVTGGAAETTRLGYDTAYEDALRQGEQGRVEALGALDRAIADARLTGDVESANAAAKAAQEQTSAYADALKYLINRQDAIDARQESYERENAARAAAYAEKLAEERRKAETAEEQASKPTLTVAQVNAALKAGILTDAVLAAYEYYYGEPYRG